MSEGPLKVLLYSDDRTVREQVKAVIGRRVAADLPEIQIDEVATQPSVLKAMDAGGYSLAIMDGEATPSGGFGLAYQLKDEIVDCPPMLLLVARQADAWLGTWSRADALAPRQIDPIALPAQVAGLLRNGR